MWFGESVLKFDREIIHLTYERRQKPALNEAGSSVANNSNEVRLKKVTCSHHPLAPTAGEVFMLPSENSLLPHLLRMWGVSGMSTVHTWVNTILG